MLSGCVSEEDPGECPGPLLPWGGRVHVPGQPGAQTVGEKEWARHTQAPRLSMPQAPTCFWSWASLGSSEWMSSLTWAPGRRARCLGSSGRPGGSPCGAHGGSGGDSAPGLASRRSPRWGEEVPGTPASYPHPASSGASPGAVPAAPGLTRREQALREHLRRTSAGIPRRSTR